MSNQTEFLLLFFQNGVFSASFPVPFGVTPVKRLLAHGLVAGPPVETGAIQLAQTGARPDLSFVAPREGEVWRLGQSPIAPGTGVTLEDGHRIRNSTGFSFVVVRRPGSQSGIRGQLERLQLDAVIGLLAEAGKSGRILIRSNGEGSVWMEDGLVVGAEWALTGETGDRALAKMVVLTAGTFEVIEMTPPPAARTIGPIASNTDLLLHVCQEVDERAVGLKTSRAARGGWDIFGLKRS